MYKVMDLAHFMINSNYAGPGYLVRAFFGAGYRALKQTKN